MVVFQSDALIRATLLFYPTDPKGEGMKDILFVALTLACPLGMLAMGAVAWLSTKVLPGRRGQAPTSQTGRAGAVGAE
jgi:hypothetical protein